MENTTVEISTERVAAELGRLQKNRGLQSADLERKVGPALARISGYQGARGREARESLIRQLMHATSELPGDLRLVFFYGLAVRPDLPADLSDRLAMVGEHIERSARVARRRLDQANLAVAERLLAIAANDRGWFHGDLVAHVDFHDREPLFQASHGIVVTAPTLERVTEVVGVHGGNDENPPEFGVSGAARMAGVRLIAPGTWEFSLLLAERQACGGFVRYDTWVRLPNRAAAEPMQVVSTQRDCWKFAVTVDLAGLASEAWLLDGVLARAALSEPPAGTPVDLTAEPAPHVVFRNLTPGLVYGLRWRWAEPN